MKYLLVLLSTLLTLAGTSSALGSSNFNILNGEANNCQDFFRSQKVSEALAIMANVRAEEPTGSHGFLPNQVEFAIIFSTTTKANCSVVYSGGGVLAEAAFQTPLSLPDSTVGVAVTYAFSVEHIDLKEMLVKIGATYAFVVNLEAIPVPLSWDTFEQNMMRRLIPKRFACEQSKPCGEFPQSAAAKTITGDLRDAGGIDLWEDYNPYASTKTAIILTHPDYCKCALVFRNKTLMLPVIEVERPFANMIYNEFSFPTVSKWDEHPELVSILKTEGIELAALVGFHDNYRDYWSALIDVTTHELFHAFHQNNEKFWLNQNLSGDARDLFGTTCYFFDAQVSSLLQEEGLALAQALKFASSGHRQESVTYARSIIITREKRYGMLTEKAVTVPDGRGARISCREAESRMEQTEGSAEFVGRKVTVAANGGSYEAVINRYLDFFNNADLKSSGDVVYYQTGSGMLFLLDFLYPAQFRGISASIARTPWDQMSIYTKLRELIASES